MTARPRPYGVDPDHPCTNLLVALYRERYGDPRDLERERFTLVDERPRPALRRAALAPVTDAQADDHAYRLGLAIEAHDRGDAA